MKQIAIKVAGSDGPLRDITIKPGTTANDILSQLDLEGYLLSPSTNSTQFFGADEVIYPLIEDGSKLYATTPAEVGGC